MFMYIVSKARSETYLARYKHDSIRRDCHTLLQAVQKARLHGQFSHSKNFGIVRDQLAQACGEAKVVRDDHGWIKRLEVQNNHWTGVKP